MTEQEKRENVIEELYDKFRKWADEDSIVSFSGATVMSVPRLEGLLTRIVIYVLRKEEEVQKETAKYILSKVGKIAADYQWFAYLCKEFGVEVES